MSVASVLARGRAAAERLMVDTCTIRRKTGETTDPDTGHTTPTYATVYSGKCRFQQGDPQATRQDAGEASLLMLAMTVQVPMSVVGVQAEDEVLPTATAYDPDLLGRTFLVKALHHKTHATSRRLGLEERTS
jgi:hypothetical protein